MSIVTSILQKKLSEAQEQIDEKMGEIIKNKLVDFKKRLGARFGKKPQPESQLTKNLRDMHDSGKKLDATLDKFKKEKLFKEGWQDLYLKKKMKDQAKKMKEQEKAIKDKEKKEKKTTVKESTSEAMKSRLQSLKDKIKKANDRFIMKDHEKIIKLKDKDKKDKMNEQLYHPTYSHAIQHVAKHLKSKGLEFDDHEYNSQVTSGKGKPSPGETRRHSISLTRNGQPVKAKMEIQVHNKGNDTPNPYELNYYQTGK